MKNLRYEITPETEYSEIEALFPGLNSQDQEDLIAAWKAAQKLKSTGPVKVSTGRKSRKGPAPDAGSTPAGSI